MLRFYTCSAPTARFSLLYRNILFWGAWTPELFKKIIKNFRTIQKGVRTLKKKFHLAKWGYKFTHMKQRILYFRDNIVYITPCVKCGFTHASRAEIHIFTPRDVKFRTILVRKTFSWRVWLHHSPSARAANSHAPEKVLSHSYRNVLLFS